jgi:CelD/BcsL family acetyltransferase involved in cellulose biosynthesis
MRISRSREPSEQLADQGVQTLPARPAGADAVQLEPIPSLDAARDAWRGLALESRNIFATWEWAETWWRHFGRGRSLHLTACRAADGSLLAILPLYSWRTRPLHILRFLGHGPGDQLGPIAAADDLESAKLALRQQLERSRWDIFLGEHLPGDQDWPAALDAKPVAHTGAPVLRFAGRTWDEVLRERSSNFRQQVGRRERALARGRHVRVRLSDDPATLGADLDVLFALHAARWGGASEFARSAQQFHRDFAAQALANGWLRLWLLEIDGTPAAAWYGFRFGQAESYYQTGWDPAWARTSVAAVLLVHSIREASHDGMEEYRFLQGDEGYKYRIAEEDPGLVTLVRTRGPLARTALALGRGARRAAPARSALSALFRAR